MGDCHSFDPGSKFGLERKTNKKKQQPNEHPGPGAAYTFFSISNSNPAKVEVAALLRDGYRIFEKTSDLYVSKTNIQEFIDRLQEFRFR